MVVDFDDFQEGEQRLDLLRRLKDANPAFRCTLFAIPGRGSDRFWESVPDWCELVPHGYLHPHSREAETWSRGMVEWVLDGVHPRFVDGWKSPGWQVSDATYEVLGERGYWIADHYDNDGRRPEGLATHVLSRTASSGGDPAHWHGHIPDVCGNGIAETFDRLIDVVAAATSFELVSECVTPWVPELVEA